MIERLQRNLLTVERSEQPLSLKVQRVIDTILRNRDIFDDDRVREIKWSRMNAAGDWSVVSTLAFERWDGTAQPYPSFEAPTRTPKARD